ncbi:hypothetical protein ACF2JD_12280 [Aeromonas sp. A-5]|uniref:hypothetical protein n=1 Tax=Aeromonas ichthyocola TaxID=3367746 RepID=UPI0038E37011
MRLASKALSTWSVPMVAVPTNPSRGLVASKSPLTRVTERTSSTSASCRSAGLHLPSGQGDHLAKFGKQLKGMGHILINDYLHRALFTSQPATGAPF